MDRVTGLGGVFFKADDPESLYSWYEEHLGLKREGGGFIFHWREAKDAERPGMTGWSLFRKDTEHFAPSDKPFMLNYRVRDIDALLDALRAEGVRVDEKRDDSEYGRFAW